MRIELVLDVPDVHVASVDVVRYGEEAARLVRNDIGQSCTLVHAAIGDAKSIVVPRDFDPSHPVRTGDAVAHDPTHPYANTVTPYNVDENDGEADEVEAE